MSRYTVRQSGRQCESEGTGCQKPYGWLIGLVNHILMRGGLVSLGPKEQVPTECLDRYGMARAWVPVCSTLPPLFS